MRWLKRGLWLAAWGVWAWLGLGLCRELPRHLQWVALLTTQPLPFPLGFVGDTYDVAVYLDAGNGGTSDSPPVVLVVDGETGALRRSFQGPTLEELRLSYGGAKYGRVLARKTPASRTEGLFALDLKGGEWKTIAIGNNIDFAEHRDRSWIAFTQADGSAVVFDYAACRAVYRFPHGAGERYIDTPVFIPGDDRIVLAKSTQTGHALEVWTLGEQTALERTIHGARLGASSVASTSGRVVSLRERNRPDFTVFDLRAERVVYTFPPRTGAPPVAPKRPDVYPLISANGRSVYCGPDYALIDVDLGTAAWIPNEYERPGPFLTYEGFSVGEMWWQLVGLPALDERLVTYAYRRYEDASLIHRTYRRFCPTRRDFSWDKRYVVSFSDGWVCRGDLLVDWRLLVFCQIILALPLILLWLAVLWRRKRRERRLAGATA
jgi:hypothetical protein